LSVTTDNRGTVSFCHRCGFSEANNHPSVHSNVAAPKSYRPWRDVAESLWIYAKPLAGTLAEKYLTGRVCRLPPDDGDLRFLPARGEFPAAMLARVTDVVTGDPISLHFTRLNRDGSKAGDVPKRLLAGHRKARGVIRLWPDECVTHGLAIAEGIVAGVNYFFRRRQLFLPVLSLHHWSTIAQSDAKSVRSSESEISARFRS
jgi:hypothetical protein